KTLAIPTLRRANVGEEIVLRLDRRNYAGARRLREFERLQLSQRAAGKANTGGCGVSIPDSAAFQQYQIARIKPGDRLPDATYPIIVLKNGKPYLASSNIGLATHQNTMNNLVNVLDFDMDRLCCTNLSEGLRTRRRGKLFLQ